MAIRLYQIRSILNLDSKPFTGLPNDLIEMAFRPSRTKVNSEKLTYLRDTYDGMTNLEDLEFVGDAVLELIATQIVFNSNNGGPGYMTRKRVALVKNTALYCIMQKLKLCDQIEVYGSYTIKDCADIFEAIIGALYYYLVYIDGEPKWMNILQSYVESLLYTPKTIDDLISHNIELDNCKINGKRVKDLGKDYAIKRQSDSRILTSQDSKELERIDREAKDFPTYPLSEASKIAIDHTLTNSSWLGQYYNEWKSKHPSFSLLQKIYNKLKVSPNIMVLSDNSNKFADWIVIINKIDFSNQVTVSEYVGIGSTQELALDEAANSALADIFAYIPMELKPKAVKSVRKYPLSTK